MRKPVCPEILEGLPLQSHLREVMSQEDSDVASILEISLGPIESD